jgi:hypothetical protein
MSQDDQRAKHLDEAEYFRTSRMQLPNAERALLIATSILAHLRSLPPEPKVEPGEGERPDTSKIDGAAKRACQEPSLVEALSWIAVWDADRAVREAIRHHDAGTRDVDGFGYHTCFLHCFRLVMDLWERERSQSNPPAALELTVEELKALDTCIRVKEYVGDATNTAGIARSALRKLNAPAESGGVKAGVAGGDELLAAYIDNRGGSEFLATVSAWDKNFGSALRRAFDRTAIATTPAPDGAPDLLRQRFIEFAEFTSYGSVADMLRAGEMPTWEGREEDGASGAKCKHCGTDDEVTTRDGESICLSCLVEHHPPQRRQNEAERRERLGG